MSARRKPASKARTSSTPAAVRVPVAPHRIWRWLLWGGGGLLTVGALAWGLALGLPQRTAEHIIVATGAAGFTVRQVEIDGVEQQPRLAIYQELLRGGTDSMFAVDVEDARTRLKALPWVKDASVERRWPDRVVVRITEHQPVAVWQLNGVLRVIDGNGDALPVSDVHQFRHLPLVIGPDANRHAAQLARLSSHAPDLFRQLKAATWIGGRRWNLVMDSGELIQLPHGDGAAPALERLAAMHRATPVLGRGFTRLDLRIEDKLVVQVAGDPGAVARPSVAPNRPVKVQEVII